MFKLIRSIAVGIGAIFMIGAVVAGAIGLVAWGHSETNEQAAVSAMQKFTKTWSPGRSDGVVHVKLANMLAKPQSQKVLNSLRRLGQLQNAIGASQTAFSMSTEKGTRATVTFKGQFANGTADVSIKLVKVGDEMKMIAFNIKHGKIRRRGEQA